jgi:hypothetical protein
LIATVFERWHSFIRIESGLVVIGSAWAWQQNHPNGYA